MKYWKPAFVVCVLLLTAFLYSSETKKDVYVTDIEYHYIEDSNATMATVAFSDGGVYIIDFRMVNDDPMFPKRVEEAIEKCLRMGFAGNPAPFRGNWNYTIRRIN